MLLYFFFLSIIFLATENSNIQLTPICNESLNASATKVLVESTKGLNISDSNTRGGVAVSQNTMSNFTSEQF